VAQRHGVRPAVLSSWRRQVARVAESTKKPAKFAAVRVNAPVVEGVIEIDLAAPRFRKAARGVKRKCKPSSPWPHIEQFLESGGRLRMRRCACCD
jgi:hypothetical protein